MAYPTYPAITFRSMRAALPDAPPATPEEQEALRRAHPFAPGEPASGGDPAAPATGPIAGSFEEQTRNSNAGIYKPGSIGEANAKASAGLYDAGTLGAVNARANGTGVVLPARYAAQPAGEPGVRYQPAPEYPTVPTITAREGSPAPGVVVPPARATLRQGQPMPASSTRFDLTAGGQPAAPLAPASSITPEAMAMGRLFPTAGQPPLLPGSDPTAASATTLAGAAAGLEDAQAGVQADRTLGLLKQAGALPVAGEAPEISASKFGYLRSRLETSLNGGTPRAPGSPVYTGTPPPVAPAAAGGVNSGQAAVLYRQLQATSNQPRMVDMGGGVRAIVDRQGNASRVPDDPNKPHVVDVAGRKLTVGPGGKYFDERGQPVDFGRDTPPRPPDPFLKTTDPELYDAQRGEYMTYVQAKKDAGAKAGSVAAPAAAASPGAATLSAADKQALSWATANPKDPRAAQIKTRLGMK